MYQLYIANKNDSSWSLRPWILLRQLDIAFTEIMIPFHSSEWQNVSSLLPAGKVPCLIDGSITVWDSLAIVEYIAETHAGVWPSTQAARAWARSACAEMHSGFNALRDCCPMNIRIRTQLTHIPAPLAHDLARLNALWQQGLDRFGGPFLTGKHFTAVDAFFAPVAFRLQSYTLSLSGHANAYAERLLNLQLMMEWEAQALKETQLK